MVTIYVAINIIISNNTFIIAVLVIVIVYILVIKWNGALIGVYLLKINSIIINVYIRFWKVIWLFETILLVLKRRFIRYYRR